MGPGPNQKGLSRKHIMESIDASLKRLKTDYVDLYIIHRADPETPIEETLDALNDVVRAGKALYLGASSMYAWQFSKMLTMQRERGWAPFVSMQNLYNLIYREEEREMHPLCVAEGIALTPYSPNARGFLAGNTRSGQETVRGKTDKMTAKMQLGVTAEDKAIADRVDQVAKQLGASMASVALAWVLAQKGMTAPVIGASKMSHLDDALKAIDLKLSPEQMKLLEEPYKPKPVVAMD
jgi:aryl-alcohol dehydrogenase (NADP+)